ncbi:MAG: DUF4230 domain-containing protein [Cuspidothrix sp.]
MTSFSGLKQTMQFATGELIISRWILFGILAFILAAFLFFSWPWVKTNESAKIRDVILGGLKETSELNTVKMSSKASVVETKDNRLFSLYLGDTKVIYEAAGTIRAGIDIKKLKVEDVDINNQKIKITLPAPYITETVLEADKSQLLDNHKNWFGPNAEIELLDQAQKDALARIKLEACGDNIIDAANSNAKKIVENILSAAGYKDVTVITQEPQDSSCPKN